MQKAKAFAFTIILVMMVVNFIVPRPWLPTLPHKSWHWLTPWPVQVIESVRQPRSTGQVARADTAQEINERILLALIAVAAGAFIEGLNSLTITLVERALDTLQSGGSGSTGTGGGGDLCAQCDF